MQITEIRVAKGRTVNLGNFESGRVDVEVSARVDATDDIDLAYSTLVVMVDNKLSEQVEFLMEMSRA